MASPRILDRAFTALADPTRRGVVRLLKGEPRRAGELADALDVARPAMSKHLRVLEEAGLVEVRASDDDARARVYRLRREPFTALRSWLDDVEGFWTAQLDSFREHVEARAKDKRAKGPRK